MEECLPNKGIMSKEEKVNFVWKNYSFYGKPVKLKSQAVNGSINRQAISKTSQDAITKNFYRFTDTTARYISDGGVTLIGLKEHFNISTKELIKIIERTYGSELVLMRGDELTIEIDGSCDRTVKKLKEFIDRLTIVCDVFCG